MKCDATGKSIFADKRATQEWQNRHKDKTVRAYPCGYCGGWHITKNLHDHKEAVPREYLNKPIKHAEAFKRFLEP